MTYQAVGDRVLVLAPPELGEMKVGDLFVPDSAKASIGNPLRRLKVLSAGPLCKTAIAGCEVILNTGSQGPVTLDDEGKIKVFCIPEAQLIAVCNVEPA